MQLNPNIKMLDQGLCAYVSSKDPMKKSSTNTVFMQKKQLSSFYGKMLSKANQEIKLQQKKSSSLDKDSNKLLVKQQQRIRQKIYNRTFHKKSDSNARLKLSQKENVKITMKPIISENIFRTKLVKGRAESKFLYIANQELLMTQFIENNLNQKLRKTKSLSQSIIINSKSSDFERLNDFERTDELRLSSGHGKTQYQDGSGHRKVHLIELYQKLYDQFTKQKLKVMHCKSRIQGKFSKGKLNLNNSRCEPAKQSTIN